MKTYTGDALARALYRMAAERMQAAGCEMPCSEDVFSALTAASPEGVRYAELETLENPDFLEAAYLLLLERPIDAPARSAWQAQLALPAEDFQTRVLTTILRSAEYQHRRIPLIGCPLPLAEDQGQNLLISAQALPERLVRMYQKMPRPVQKLAKKIAGKE